MYLSRSIAIAVITATMTGPAFAGSDNTVCHNGKSISGSPGTLNSHQDDGDTNGTCATRPPAPVYKDVAIIRCKATDEGDVVVSEQSGSEHKAGDAPEESGQESCASAVAHMLIMGTAFAR